jgi:transcriptional regulator with XRE-family HTH domain
MYDSTPIARRHRRVTEGLHRARLDGGFTLRALAARAGVTPEYLSRVERGIKRPGPALLLGLATILDVPLDQISIIDAPSAQADDSADQAA